MAISIDIPEAEIKNALAVAVAESFAPDKRDALLRDIIRTHISAKKDDYSKQTILDAAVGSQIRSMATNVLTAEIEKMRPEVEAIVAEMLGPKFKIDVIAQLKLALSHVSLNNLTITARIDADED